MTNAQNDMQDQNPFGNGNFGDDLKFASGQLTKVYSKLSKANQNLRNYINKGRGQTRELGAVLTRLFLLKSAYNVYSGEANPQTYITELLITGLGVGAVWLYDQNIKRKFNTEVAPDVAEADALVEKAQEKLGKGLFSESQADEVLKSIKSVDIYKQSLLTGKYADKKSNLCALNYAKSILDSYQNLVENKLTL